MYTAAALQHHARRSENGLADSHAAIDCENRRVDRFNIATFISIRARLVTILKTQLPVPVGLPV